MTTVEFHSPSGRVRLVVEGRHLLDQNDIEWLKFIGSRPGLISDRIGQDAEAARQSMRAGGIASSRTTG